MFTVLLQDSGIRKIVNDGLGSGKWLWANIGRLFWTVFSINATRRSEN